MLPRPGRFLLLIGVPILLVMSIGSLVYLSPRNAAQYTEMEHQLSCEEEDLELWTKRNGASYPKLELAEFEYTDVTPELLGMGKKTKGIRRGIRAKEDIESGEIIFEAPISQVFCPKKAMDDKKLGPAIKELELILEHPLSQMEVFTVHLVYEKFKANSAWKPWLCSLPQDVPTVLTWTGKQRKAAEENMPIAVSLANSRADVIKRSYYRIFPILFTIHPSLFKSHVHTLEAYTWAYNLLISRNWVVGPDEPCQSNRRTHVVVPFIDMLNHKAYGASVSWNKTHWMVVARTDYTPGEEVFYDYGSHCNEEYLANYGFALPANKLTCD